MPATPKETPHRVLGEEAQAQQAHWSEELDPHRPLEGLAVDVEITDFPAVGRPARGRVIEVLGPPDAFGVDVEIVIRKHHLPHVFPANVLAEATASGGADGGYAGGGGAGQAEGFSRAADCDDRWRDGAGFRRCGAGAAAGEWQLGAAGAYCGCEPLRAAGDGAGS